MVSRVYPPPKSPRTEAGRNLPVVKDDQADIAGPEKGAVGRDSAPKSATPPGARTSISPLARSRPPLDEHPPAVASAALVVPKIDSADFAWPTEQPTPPPPIDDESLSIHRELSAFEDPAPFDDATSTLDGGSELWDLADGSDPMGFDRGEPGAGWPSGPAAAGTLTLERPAPVLEQVAVPSRFEFSAEPEPVATKTLSARMVQGTVLLALVAAVAAFIVILPEDGSTSAESAESTTQVRAVAAPTASADLLSPSDGTEVEGALADAGALGRVTSFSAAGIGTPADSGEGFAAAVVESLDQTEPPDAAPTTTTWVEPVIPPESEWVDGGNDVPVPDVLLRIRFCESTNNYKAANPRSTASGAYQFLDKSWDYYGHAAQTGVAEAHLATRAQQDQAAIRTLESQGTRPWLASRSCWASDGIDPGYATASPKPAVTTTAAAGQEPTTTDTGESTTSTDDSTPDTTAPDTTTTETPEETTTTTAGGTTTTSTTTPTSTTPTT